MGPGCDTRFMVTTASVDFTKGAHPLVALVEDQYDADPFSGVVHVFPGREYGPGKAGLVEATGFLLMNKRLEQCGVRWPGIHDGVIRLSSA